MSTLFRNKQSSSPHRIAATRSFVVLAVTLVIILEMVPSALAFTFSQFQTPTGQADPTVITLGPDGSLWFTETAANKIGRITPTGAITEFPLPTPASLPSGITGGPDGNLWFTEPGNAKIGRISPSGTITEFSLQTGKSDLFSDIAAGPDGALWFIDPSSSSIGQITTQGVIKEFPIPAKGANPFGITSGTDGGVWFTEPGVNQIGRLNPVTGAFSALGIPTQASSPGFITAGPDGALWFTEFNANQIGRLVPTTGITAGIINEFPVPTKQSGPDGITSGPDGAIWFTEDFSGKIGQVVLTPGLALELSPEIAPAAVFIEYLISPAANPGPKDITTGPDRNLWFTEGTISAIGRLTPDVQQVIADLSVSVSAPVQVASGNQLSYTVAVTNLSAQQTATGVTVSAPIPAGTTFSSVSGTGAKITPPPPGLTGTISAALGSLGPGAIVRFQVTVNVLAASGTNLSETATVTSTSTDPNPANNTATANTLVQGGGIVYLSWHQGPSTATDPTPAPDHLTASAAKPPPPPTDQITTQAEIQPAATPCSGPVGYNIYIASTPTVAIIPTNLWVAMVPPDQVNDKVVSRPGGTFYAMTSLWNCGGTITESGSSNTASATGGPELDSVKVTGKIRLFGNNFSDPASGAVTTMFIDGFQFQKQSIFIDSTFLKQKGQLDVNGTPTAIQDYITGKPNVVISVQVQSAQCTSQNPCISSISFSP